MVEHDQSLRTRSRQGGSDSFELPKTLQRAKAELRIYAWSTWWETVKSHLPQGSYFCSNSATPGSEISQWIHTLKPINPR